MQSDNIITKKQPNPDGAFGLSPVVYPVKVVCGNGQEQEALFTQHELQRAIKRGAKYCQDGD